MAMHDLKAKGVEEGKRFLVMFLYLWLILSLFIVYKTVILATETLYAEHGFAIINALVLAKVMLVADHLKLGHRFEMRPLIYPILLKAAVFAVVIVLFHTLETIVSGLISGNTLVASLPHFGSGTVRGLLAFWAILAVALIPFFAMRELAREFGEDQMWSVLFGREE